MDLALLYEPGYLWFAGSSEASPNFKVPTDTYEGRLHFRLRVDALDRNLLELPHRGFSLGGDVIYGHRAHWEPWGGVVFLPPPDAATERDWLAASAYAVAAGPVPLVDSERHRLIAELYGGLGKNLDRFSAFRLPGRPTGYEWEALSRPILPGVAFNELFPQQEYGIVNLTYRYEVLFFVYPYVRGTWAILDRPLFQPDGSVRNEINSLTAVGAGIVSGAPWKSQIEINYSYNFDMWHSVDSQTVPGRNAFFILWAKEL